MAIYRVLGKKNKKEKEKEEKNLADVEEDEGLAFVSDESFEVRPYDAHPSRSILVIKAFLRKVEIR